MSRSRSSTYGSGTARAMWTFRGRLSGDVGDPSHRVVDESGEVNLGSIKTTTKTIVDERGPRKAFKPCTIVRDEWELLPVTVRFRTECPRYNVSGSAECNYYTYGGVGQYSAAKPGHAAITSQIDWLTAMRTLYDSAAGYMASTIQTLDNFASIPETINLAHNVRDGITRLFRKRGGIFKRIVTVADLYLTYKFGMETLGEDIGEFFASAFKLKDAVQRAKERSGKWVRVSALAPCHASVENTDRPTPTYGPAWYARSEVNVRAGVSGSFFTEVKDANPYLRAGLASLGMVNIPKAAWESLPLSFVADWAGDVSGMLERMPIYHQAQQLSQIVAVRDVSHFILTDIATTQEFFPFGCDYWPHLDFWKWYWGNFSSDWSRALQALGWVEAGRRKTFTYQRILGAPLDYNHDEYVAINPRFSYSVPRATGSALIIKMMDDWRRRHG